MYKLISYHKFSGDVMMNGDELLYMTLSAVNYTPCWMNCRATLQRRLFFLWKFHFPLGTSSTWLIFTLSSDVATQLPEGRGVSQTHHSTPLWSSAPVPLYKYDTWLNLFSQFDCNYTLSLHQRLGSEFSPDWSVMLFVFWQQRENSRTYFVFVCCPLILCNPSRRLKNLNSS